MAHHRCSGRPGSIHHPPPCSLTSCSFFRASCTTASETRNESVALARLPNVSKKRMRTVDGSPATAAFNPAPSSSLLCSSGELDSRRIWRGEIRGASRGNGRRYRGQGQEGFQWRGAADGAWHGTAQVEKARGRAGARGGKK